jgi:hypothetical protein
MPWLFGQLLNQLHLTFPTLRTACDIGARESKHHLDDGLLEFLWQFRTAADELSDQWDGMLLVGVSQEAEVTDLHEAAGKNMKQEASNELIGPERHGPDCVVSASIPIREDDFAVSG